MGTYKIQKRQHLTAVGKRRAELLHRNFVLKQTFVLRMKYSAKNPALCQAAKC